MPTDKKENIYLIYNEMHSDILLNITQVSNLNNLITKKKQGYIAIGWGDKETYLNTPTWSKLKISTAFKALFINTPSLIHLSYYQNIKRFKNLKSITVTPQQIELLEKRIMATITKKEKYNGYGRDDVFYSAKGKYNIFNTCNTWTGQQLRDVNISLSYWTPFSFNLINSLP